MAAEISSSCGVGSYSWSVSGGHKRSSKAATFSSGVKAGEESFRVRCILLKEDLVSLFSINLANLQSFVVSQLCWRESTKVFQDFFPGE